MIKNQKKHITANFMNKPWEKFKITEAEYAAVKSIADEVMLRTVIREFLSMQLGEEEILAEKARVPFPTTALKKMNKVRKFLSPESKKEKKERQKRFVDAEAVFKTLNTRITNRIKGWDKLVSDKGQKRIEGMMRHEINKLKNAIKKYGSDLEQVEDKNHPAYQELNNLVSSYSELAKKYSGKKLKKGTKMVDVLGSVGFTKDIAGGILKMRNPWKGASKKAVKSAAKKGPGFFKGDTSITKRFDTILGKKSMQPMKLALSQIKSRKGTAAAFKHFMDELPSDARKHLPLVLRDILGNLKK